MTSFRTLLVFFLSGIVFAPSADAKLFLVAKVVGEVSTRTDSGEEAAFGKARWLPRDMRVFTRARSGVEALSPGFSIRFGEHTVFAVDSENLQIHKGALLIRVMGSKPEGLVVEGPEASLKVGGKGAFLLEVAINGGFKIVGLTGNPAVSIGSAGAARVLPPGELLFLKPLDGGWSDPVQINLGKLVKSSFLLSGFSNPPSFDKELALIAKIQAELITKTFRAEVGDAREADSFDLKVRPPEKSQPPAAAPVPVPSSVKEPAEPRSPHDLNALPQIPGPPLEFHAPEKPAPTLKELFEKVSPAKFPGRIFNR